MGEGLGSAPEAELSLLLSGSCSPSPPSMTALALARVATVGGIGDRDNTLETTTTPHT